MTKNAKENAITMAHKELFLNVKQNRDLIQNKRNVSQKFQVRKKAEVKSRQNKIEAQGNKPFYDLNNSFLCLKRWQSQIGKKKFFEKILFLYYFSNQYN